MLAILWPVIQWSEWKIVGDSWSAALSNVYEIGEVARWAASCCLQIWRLGYCWTCNTGWKSDWAYQRYKRLVPVQWLDTTTSCLRVSIKYSYIGGCGYEYWGISLNIVFYSNTLLKFRSGCRLLINITGTRDECIDGIYCSYRARGSCAWGWGAECAWYS